MKKLLFAVTAMLLLCSVNSIAQDAAKKRKPGFTLNEQAMTELGLTTEQKQKVAESVNLAREDGKKLLAEGVELNTYCQKRIDSVLTDQQKQKVATMKEAVVTYNKENPTTKKTFAFDQKTMDELGLNAEQQKKLNYLKGFEQVSKWKHTQKLNKVNADYQAREAAILTEAQNKKVAEIKASIAEYNKTI